MGGMTGAKVDAEVLGMRQLVERGLVWSMAGHAGMPASPLFAARQGRTVIITVSNRTAWPHAMHLHGHHFQTVIAGRAAGPLRDTLVVGRAETVEIAFVADNPGDWLLHCHMVEHSAAGMMTWLRVA
jgi:FtsP/CotA-like multicopper oxidase with cupredoxin domain